MGVKVRERPGGSGVWWIYIDHQGKRKAKKIGNDEKTAIDVAKKIEAKLILGELNIEKIRSECPTFNEYAQTWLALPHDWKESTRESYENNLKLHVYPAIGKRRLDEIRRKDLKAFFDNLLIKGNKKKGLSSSTVTLVRAPINGVLSHAMDSELIESNPLHKLKLKYKNKELEVDPLTEEETNLLLDQANEYLVGFYYGPSLCALRTGMRIGEIQALQWEILILTAVLLRSREAGEEAGSQIPKIKSADVLT